MILLPAIDLYEKKAVRLYKGDYSKMTVYSSDPVATALSFKNAGAEWIHLVDLEGARLGKTPNLDVVSAIKKESGLHVEIGGGIRSTDVMQAYADAGVDRMILGTAAADEAFLTKALALYGDKIAVGADIKDGFVAVKGWIEKTDLEAFSFCSRMQTLGVKTLIVTDISRDGALRGSNRALYQELSSRVSIDLIASGGVSTVEDVRALKALGLYGAIVGKALYTGDLSLKEALEAARI